MASTDYKNLRVLIVDDYMIIRKLVSQQLSMMGIELIDTAIDGLDAERKLESARFDIVLLDWGMPNKDGLEVLKSCKQDGNNKFRNTAFIMLTGESETKSVKDALDAGATSYLVKPVDFDSLKSKIDSAADWLEKRQVSQ